MRPSRTLITHSRVHPIGRIAKHVCASIVHSDSSRTRIRATEESRDFRSQRTVRLWDRFFMILSREIPETVRKHYRSLARREQQRAIAGGRDGLFSLLVGDDDSEAASSSLVLSQGMIAPPRTVRVRKESRKGPVVRALAGAVYLDARICGDFFSVEAIRAASLTRLNSYNRLAGVNLVCPKLRISLPLLPFRLHS